jgi:hypothetical protein
VTAGQFGLDGVLTGARPDDSRIAALIRWNGPAVAVAAEESGSTITSMSSRHPPTVS